MARWHIQAMSTALPVAPSSRTELLELLRKKDRIEADIAALVHTLPKGVPARAPHRSDLIDAEGFPRSDIDVHQVRITRNAIATLQYDHTALMKTIEQGMEAMHAAQGPTGATEHSAQPRPASVPAPSAASARVPALPAAASDGPAFLRVSAVIADSPAQHAGLCSGDHVLAFGSLHHSNWSLPALQQLVADSENTPVTVVVWRNPEGRLVLRLTPAKWSGRGLLGCGIVPIEQPPS